MHRHPVVQLSFIPFAFLLVFNLLNAASHARPADDLMSLNEASTGALLIKSTTPGKYVPAPALATDVHMTITGTINRTIVTQKFRNPSDQWIEATYAFPLPEGSAVDELKMIIGDRVIEGLIQEKEEARKTFEAAKTSGRKASLVEQQRPNLFTNEVANIGPFETIIVQIEYQDSVRVADGAWSVRFPMIVGARYNPAPDTGPGEPGETLHQLDPVPNRDKIPSHYDKTRTNPVTLAVTLNAGMPLQSIETPFHRTSVTEEDQGQFLIELSQNTTANKDFELIWVPKVGTAPAVTTFIEKQGSENFALITLTPPRAAQTLKTYRELILAIDVSGSMSGSSIVQAKAGALAALARLGPEDSINIITFSSETHVLFPRAQLVSPNIRRQAHNFISAITAGGGTEIYPAITAALTTADMRDGERLRQIVFMTDGSVGNEDQLFALIHEKLGNSRLFTVGIGSAPNSHFMTRAATMGRGTFTFIGATNQVEDRMKVLFNKLESPAMTDITVTWPDGSNADLAQNIVPDLYAGEPIVLAAKLTEAAGTVTVAGTLAGEPWQQTVKLAAAMHGDGIGKLWARQKIAALSEAQLRGADKVEIRNQILALALGHHLVSTYTSLVAVDVTPGREKDASLIHKDIPLMIPEGWTMFDAAEAQAVYHPSPLLMTQIMPSSPASVNPLVLPQTATGLQFGLLFGLLMMVAGLWFLFPFRRQPSSAQILALRARSR